MTENAVQPAGPAASDANASPESVTPEGTTGTGSEAAPSPAVTTDDEPTLKGVSRRIDELTRYRREAERERDHWREMAMRQQAPREEAKPVETVKTLADFNYDEPQYQAYLVREASKAATEAARRELKEQSERDAAARRQTTFSSREAEFSKKTPDYYEKTRDPRVPVTPEIAEVLAESEDGPALAYYLANNLAIADQVSRLPPLAAARELGRIEARLAAEREKAKTPPPVSPAPPPPPKIEGAADPKVEKDPKDMSDAEFSKWRKRQIAQRR
jgi:hypothetical protein